MVETREVCVDTLREDVNAGHTGQTHTYRGLYWMHERSIRVHINYDSSHRDQSWATAEMWTKNGWVNVVDFIGTQIPDFAKSQESISRGMWKFRGTILDEVQDVRAHEDA